MPISANFFIYLSANRYRFIKNFTEIVSQKVDFSGRKVIFRLLVRSQEEPYVKNFFRFSSTGRKICVRGASNSATRSLFLGHRIRRPTNAAASIFIKFFASISRKISYINRRQPTCVEKKKRKEKIKLSGVVIYKTSFKNFTIRIPKFFGFETKFFFLFSSCTAL